MNAHNRSMLAASFGILMIKLVTGGGYRAYVRPRMGPLLLLAGLSLTLVASVLLLTSPGHAVARRQHGGRLEPFLVVPIVLLAVIPPVPLGAAAAAMRAGARMTPRASGASGFPPLPPPVGGAIPLTVSDFVGRALYDTDGSLTGVRVRLIGLAGTDPGAPPGGFLLVRFAMFCCAADAIPIRIHIRGRPSRSPPSDSWVEVTGSWRPAPTRDASRFDPSMMPTFDAVSVRSVPEPADPYDPPF